MGNFLKLKFNFCLVLLLSCYLIQQTEAWSGWFNSDASKEDNTPISAPDNEIDEDEMDLENIHTIKEVEPEPIEPFSTNQDQNRDDQQQYKSHLNNGGYPEEPRYEHTLDTRREQSSQESYLEHQNIFGQVPEQTCSEGQYMCRKVSPSQSHVRCIPNEWKCNGVRDCEENDDEDNCNNEGHRVNPYDHHRSQGQVQHCPTGQHTCYGTGIHGIPVQCLEMHQVCDQRNDCPYGDDERSCSQQQSHNGEGQQQQQRTHQPEQQQSEYPYPYNYPGQQSSQQPSVHDPSQSGHYNVTNRRYPGYDGQGSGQPIQQSGVNQDSCRGGRSEEYIRRLEFLDRCYRSCMKSQF